MHKIRGGGVGDEVWRGVTAPKRHSCHTILVTDRQRPPPVTVLTGYITTNHTVVSIATTLCQHRESLPSRNMSSVEPGNRLPTLPTVSPLLCRWLTCRWLVLLLLADFFFFFLSLRRYWPYLTHADRAIRRAKTPSALAPMDTYNSGMPNW